MHLLYLGELVLHDQLRFCAIPAQNRETSREISEAAFLIFNDALRFNPILDNRVKPGLARFEGAIAPFGLSCLRARHY